MATPTLRILPVRRISPPNKKTARETSQEPSGSGNEHGHDDARQKKARASKPKVRTGCVTCKIRRVKCDETKPSCSRCTSTGRKCDGYYIPPRKNRRIDPSETASSSDSTENSPERCLEAVQGTAEELRALEYFHARTGPNLSGYFDAGFWTRLVLQISHVEPAIMHAMVAVGHLNHQRELGTTHLPLMLPGGRSNLSSRSVPTREHQTDHNDPFAIAQYNKSIALLTKRMRDPDVATEVALLACILFVCIEFLRGDVNPAIQHFKSGMNIARAALRADSTKSILSMERIKEGLLPFFERLELLAMLFGHDTYQEYSTPLEDAVPESFTGLREARDSLVHLRNISLRFIRSMKHRRYDRLVLPDQYARQATIQQELERWNDKLDALLLTDTVSSRDLDAAKVLRIHQLIQNFWLGTCCDAAECANDQYMDDFETAVSLGEAIQQKISSTTFEQRRTYQPSFLFDMEIVSPMYFVAIKCRHPMIRRRAIAVLRTANRREGLWDSDMAAAIAAHIAMLEEFNLTSFDGSELPAEVDRIHNTQIHSPVGITSDEHRFRCFAKPEGIYAPFREWEESIPVHGVDEGLDVVNRSRYGDYGSYEDH